MNGNCLSAEPQKPSDRCAPPTSRRFSRRLTLVSSSDEAVRMGLSFMGLLFHVAVSASVAHQSLNPNGHDPEQMVLNSDPQGRDPLLLRPGFVAAGLNRRVWPMDMAAGGTGSIRPRSRCDRQRCMAARGEPGVGAGGCAPGSPAGKFARRQRERVPHCKPGSTTRAADPGSGPGPRARHRRRPSFTGGTCRAWLLRTSSPVARLRLRLRLHRWNLHAAVLGSKAARPTAADRWRHRGARPACRAARCSLFPPMPGGPGAGRAPSPVRNADQRPGSARPSSPARPSRRSPATWFVSSGNSAYAEHP